MRFNEATIQELRDVLRQEYGRVVSSTEAQEIASMLVNFFGSMSKTE